MNLMKIPSVIDGVKLAHFLALYYTSSVLVDKKSLCLWVCGGQESGTLLLSDFLLFLYLARVLLRHSGGTPLIRYLRLAADFSLQFSLSTLFTLVNKRSRSQSVEIGSRLVVDVTLPDLSLVQSYGEATLIERTLQHIHFHFVILRDNAVSALH